MKHSLVFPKLSDEPFNLLHLLHVGWDGDALAQPELVQLVLRAFALLRIAGRNVHPGAVPYKARRYLCTKEAAIKDK
jgi:hypothetical protein